MRIKVMKVQRLTAFPVGIRGRGVFNHMKSLRLTAKAVFGALGFFTAICSAAAQSQTLAAAFPLADHIPSGALVYIGWAGQPSGWSGYQGSNFEKFIAHSQIGALVQPALSQLVQNQGQSNPIMGAILGQVSSYLGLLFSHPFAIYILGINPGANGGPPQEELGLIVDAGSDESAILQMLNTGVSPNELVGNSGNIVYRLLNPTDNMKSLASGTADQLVTTLANDPNFTSALADSPANPAYAIYINLAGLKSTADTAMASPMVPPQALQAYKTANPLSPLNPYKTLGLAGGLVNGNWITSEFLGGAAADNQGAAAVQHLLSIVPADSPDLATFTLDTGAIYDWSQDILKQVGGDYADMVNSSIQQANAMTGLDLKNDLLACLGPHWIFYHSNAMQEAGWRGDVLVNHLNDAETLQQNLQIVGPMIVLGLNAYARQSGYQGPPGKLQLIKQGDAVIYCVQSSNISPSWTIYKGDFYFSLFPAPLQEALRSRSADQSILAVPGFQNMLKQVGAPATFTDVSFTDAPSLVAQGYLLLQSLVQSGQAAGGVNITPSLTTILPGMDDLKAMLIPSGSASWIDSAGLHMRSISAFPGSFLLTPQSPGFELNFFNPLAAVWADTITRIGVLAKMGQSSTVAQAPPAPQATNYVPEPMPNQSSPPSPAQQEPVVISGPTPQPAAPQPSVVQTFSPQPAPVINLAQLTPEQLAAAKAQSSDNITDLAQSCIVYAHENNDQMPGGLNDLVSAGLVASAELTPPGAGNTYVYTGSGLGNSLDSKLIVLYEADDYYGKGRYVAFANGVAQWASDADLADLFNANNDERRKLGLPVISVPGQ
jgi:hypothetical protein